MHIQFTGRHVEVSEELRDYTTTKFKRLLNKIDKVISVQVTFAVEKLAHIAEANVHIPGIVINAKSESDSQKNAILDVIEKLLVQVEKHKDKH